MADTTIDMEALPGRASGPARRLIAGRYEPSELLGRGGFGTVWRAHDLRLGVDVALKLLPADGDLEAGRREITALRWARVPGVVQLRDEGIDGGTWFIVMDLVDGVPFPGRPSPLHWSDLVSGVRRLLGVLARLHARGLHHRDLKPANVLVDGLGQPTLVDLGISTGPAGTAVDPQQFVGTPRYASPEQCRRQPTTCASDLYSLGVMVTEALGAPVPHMSPSTIHMLRRRATDPAPSLADTLPSAPEEAVRFVDALLASDPAQRPAHGLAALRRLGTEAPLVATSVSTRDVPWQDLRRRFGGHDRFLHLPTDAALALWRRTGGKPHLVDRELNAWVHGGLAFVERGRVHVERRALDALEGGLRLDPVAMERPRDPDQAHVVDWVRFAFPQARARELCDAMGWADDRFRAALLGAEREGWVWRGAGDRWYGGAPLDPASSWTADRRRAAHRALADVAGEPELRLQQLIASDAPACELVEGALQDCARLIATGRGPRATLLLRRTLGLAAEHAPDRVPDLLASRCAAAVAAGTVTSCDDALYDVERAQQEHEGLESLSHLLRAYRALYRGELQRAREQMARCPGFHEPPLDVAWQRLGLEVARKEGIEHAIAFLEARRTWASDRRRRARWLSWMGTLRYGQGQFEASAQLCREAAPLLSGGERTGAEINAAGALLECHRLAEAESLARRAARRARRQRDARHEAVAVWIGRAVAHRSGGAHPRDDMVGPAQAVGAYTGALYALNEAAIAWRAGNEHLARELATRAGVAFRSASQQRRADLAFALAVAAGGDGDHRALAQRAALGDKPELDVQILGLLALARKPIEVERVRELAATIPRERRDRCLDVLSIRNCLASSEMLRNPPLEEIV